LSDVSDFSSVDFTPFLSSLAIVGRSQLPEGSLRDGFPKEQGPVQLFCFMRDSKGGVAPLVALAAIPLIAGVGAAVDYSRANAARSAPPSRR
jgi:hypothetical protein